MIRFTSMQHVTASGSWSNITSNGKVRLTGNQQPRNVRRHFRGSPCWS
ncbi:MAG: hypothetical protein L6V92_02640 [Phocaeicola vulgatus]|nr:MAG: hypothetical protein L6V92_02640 [Phocaeicola vulgatus]